MGIVHIAMVHIQNSAGQRTESSLFTIYLHLHQHEFVMTACGTRMTSTECTKTWEVQYVKKLLTNTTQ